MNTYTERNRLFSLSQLSLCVGLACSSMAAWAQSADVQQVAQAHVADAGEPVLKTVVISASRVEEDADKVPGTVTVVDPAKKNKAPVDLKDLLDDEVGVSVRVQAYRSQLAATSPGRAGNEGINIRGLEGDKVMLLVDGVGLPSSYSFNSIQFGRGDYIDPEGYKRVEILRGATSTQYGSSGLAGSVMFVTKEPEDYLKGGKTQQFSVKTAYSSADRSFQLAPSYAFRADEVQGLIVASLRSGHETSSMGTNGTTSASRTEANPQDKSSAYVMAKLKQKVSGDHGLKLTLESIRRETKTNNLSVYGVVSAGATLYTDNSVDTVNRTMAKLDWQYTPLNNWFDKLDASVYGQTSSVEQQAAQTRSTTNRTRDAFYDEDTVGGSVQFESNWAGGKALSNRLVYGLDGKLTQYEMVVNRTGDANTPVKYFPDTDSRTMGAFVQNEIGLGSVTVTPGLRYDRYALSPKQSVTGYTTTTYEKLSDGAFSPKLGVNWALQPEFSVYGLYTHGFRAPQVGQINGSFSNGTQYITLGNPKLKSEQSNTIEFGARGQAADLKYSAAVFYGRYKDFIADLYNTGSCTVDGTTYTTCYQSVNLSKVTIHGFELRGDLPLDDRWRATAAYAHILGKSENKGTEDYLATVDPDKLIASLQYNQGKNWGAVGRMTAVERKGSVPGSTYIVPGGYTVFDLSGWYQFSKSTSMTAGLYNLGDKKYTRWSDVRGLAASSVAIADAYTQTGRNFAISLTHNF